MRLGLYQHPVDGGSWFYGEHVMDAGGSPLCGAKARLVAPTSDGGGFGTVCRVCLRALVEELAERPVLQ
jgi:hypothetical protein